MSYRVVQWSTGNVGTHALAGIIANPQLELVGVWVSSDAKAGVDAGILAGLDAEVGIAATTDADALIALRPDCVVYTAMTDNRLVEALADLRRFLAAGINVVASAPVFLQFPFGVIPQEVLEPLETAAGQGNSSIWVNGIDPGFANDLLPLAHDDADPLGFESFATHHLTLDEAPRGYEMFQKKEDGAIKVLFKP